MGKTNYKGLRIDYKPNQKVKVMLGHDWFDAAVVKSNKKTVVVRTLFSRTKYRQVQVVKKLAKEGGIAEDIAEGRPKMVLEPYTVSGTRTVKLPRIRVKPIEGLEPPPTPASQETVEEEASAPEPEYEGPGLGKDEAPLIDEPKAEPKPESAADVLAELEKLIG